VAAQAQPAPAGGQPADAATAEPPPKPERGTTSQLACIGSSSETKGDHGSYAYVTTLENKCEERIICRLFVHAVHAKGSTLGRTTLTLGRKSEGAAAKKSYAMKVPTPGGMTMSTRECRVY
jgi:hypothetical protein